MLHVLFPKAFLRLLEYLLCLFWLKNHIGKHIFANSLFTHLEIPVDVQGWLAEVCLDDGDPITRQIPLLPSNFFFTLHTGIIQILVNDSALLSLVT